MWPFKNKESKIDPAKGYISELPILLTEDPKGT